MKQRSIFLNNYSYIFENYNIGLKLSNIFVLTFLCTCITLAILK